ncbi:hypothetical protein COOONC_24681 [Cooperia oncophora]
MSFALIFFPHTRTSDVVPISSIPHGTKTGDTTKVRWEGRSYKGKVLFVGPKELCEMKTSSVSTDGELVEDVFDVSCALADQVSASQTDTAGERSSAREREEMMRSIRMEEDISLIKNMLIQINATLAAHSQRMDILEQIGNIVYAYASPKTVAELRELKGQNKNQFSIRTILTELERLVDERVATKDRVVFIQQCLCKYYDIPENAREDVWRKAKDALNSRVRRLRKAMRDGQTSAQNVDQGDEFSRLDLYD